MLRMMLRVRDAGLVSPGRESVVPERVDDEEEVAEGKTNEGSVSPGRGSVVRDSIVPERVDDGDKRARNEQTSVDSDVPLLERRRGATRRGKERRWVKMTDSRPCPLFGRS